MTFRTIILSLCAIAAAGALGFSLITTGSAQRDLSDAERGDIEEIVKDYILENPEIIIQALQRYDDQQAMMAEVRAQDNLQVHLPALLSVETGYAAGASAENAQVAVIELFDYHCGFCKRATDLVNDLIEEEDDIRVIFQDLPILREESEYAAKAALAAREQGKYRDMHFAMMSSAGVLTKERIDDLARANGVNVAQLHETIAENNYSDELSEIYSIAVDLGVSGTPAFIVATPDGSYSRLLQGWQPERLQEAIEEARQAS